MQKAPPSEALVDELKRFLLSSSKNTEQFGPELLRCIDVSTQLDSVLLKAVREGRDVVIAGTAGSGKTHLLARLAEAIPEYPLVNLGDESGSQKKYIRVIADLTALSDEEREVAFERPRNCASVVICANEGALLMAAYPRPHGSGCFSHGVYRQAVELLHEMQRGVRTEPREGPVVLDAAGYDPTHGNALVQMLQNRVLAEVVERHSGCDCEGSECPRRQAWKILGDAESCRRVASLVAATALGAEGFTFRVLWNFVADLALGGGCHAGEAGPPTSVWFWRLFRGESEVSERLRAMFAPKAFAMPAVESRLWYGDWTWFDEQNRLRKGGPGLIVLPRRPCDLGQVEGLLAFEWLKSQVLFTLKADVFEGARSMAAAGQLWASLLDGHAPAVIKELNRYMTYGLGTAGTSLELWLDYSIERRLERPDGQVSIGRPAAAEFAITRNLAASNIELEGPGPVGSRLFLFHSTSRASLSLTRETLAIIVGGRSFRMADRIHTEVDWLLMRFFSEVGATAVSPNHLRIALLNFKTRSMRQVDWDIAAAPPSVSLVS